ncbi:MAG: hypothetical protein IPP33_10480 [Flavobacteriales bacterium]|nr:hypothetical protein [Flavobacteriales bacterium]
MAKHPSCSGHGPTHDEWAKQPGNPPRTMLAYSLTQQFFVLHHFGIIGDGFEGAINTAALMLERDKAEIQAEAK